MSEHPPIIRRVTEKLSAGIVASKAAVFAPTARFHWMMPVKLWGIFVEHYNNIRLHSAIGYVPPLDKLLGNERAIFKRRDEKLHQAREARKQRRRAARNCQRATVAMA